MVTIMILILYLEIENIVISQIPYLAYTFSDKKPQKELRFLEGVVLCAWVCPCPSHIAAIRSKRSPGCLDPSSASIIEPAKFVSSLVLSTKCPRGQSITMWVLVCRIIALMISRLAGKTLLWIVHRNTAKLTGNITISTVPLAFL
jgi:hypothetical protein